MFKINQIIGSTLELFIENLEYDSEYDISIKKILLPAENVDLLTYPIVIRIGDTNQFTSRAWHQYMSFGGSPEIKNRASQVQLTFEPASVELQKGMFSSDFCVKSASPFTQDVSFYIDNTGTYGTEVFQCIPRVLKAKLGESKVCGVLGGSNALNKHPYSVLFGKNERSANINNQLYSNLPILEINPKTDKLGINTPKTGTCVPGQYSVIEIDIDYAPFQTFELSFKNSSIPLVTAVTTATTTTTDAAETTSDSAAAETGSETSSTDTTTSSTSRATSPTSRSMQTFQRSANRVLTACYATAFETPMTAITRPT